MTEHVPRLPFSVDPLMAEAKRRARRRRTLILLAVLLLAALGGSLAFAFGSSSGGSPNGGGLTSASHHAAAAQQRAIVQARSAGTADCGNGRSAPAYAVSGDGFKPETYTTKTVTPKGTYLGAVTSVGGRVNMTVNTCDGAGGYTVRLIDTEQPRTFVAASMSWTR